MITALKTNRPEVAIRFQPANDGAQGAPMLAGVVPRDTRRSAEQVAWHESGDLGALSSARESTIAARHDALLQKLAVEEAERARIDLRSGEVAWRIHALRDRYGLDSAAAMQDWLRQAGITFEQLSAFFRAEILVEKIEQLYAARINHELELHRALLSACAGLGRPIAAQEGDEMAAFMGDEGDMRSLRRRILLRMLASRELARVGAAADRREVEAMSDRFRECFGLFQASEMMSFLTFSGLSHESFTRQMRELASVRKLDLEGEAEVDERVALGRAVKTVAAWSERNRKAH